jgi:nucleotide-binding universal stress UspA family protein
VNSNRKKILIAVDGSNQSLEAVRYVSKVFPSDKIEVTLFHVFSEIPEFIYDLGKESQYCQTIESTVGWEKILEAPRKRFMCKARQILIDEGVSDAAITTNIHEINEGIVRDVLIESNLGYSGVVVGRSGLSKFKDFIIGSVANKLVEGLTQVSICVVGGSPTPYNILLALDQSEGAMRAVDYVGTMFDGSGPELTLIHVLRGFDILEQRYDDRLDPEQEQEWMVAGKKEMEFVFQEARTRLLNTGFDAKRLTTKIITDVSSRSGAIVQEARDGGHGTIVVGRRGLSKVEEFVMGRVSRKVIQLARERAVWVVP